MSELGFILFLVGLVQGNGALIIFGMILMTLD